MAMLNFIMLVKQPFVGKGVDEYIASLIRLVSIHTNNFTLCIISIIHMIYYTFWAMNRKNDQSYGGM